MPDTSRIYIPKRVSGMLRGIYTSRVTVVIAPDGCGKSTLVREFTSRTRPAGISLRTITGAGNTGECFAQICAIVTGQEFAEPLSEREFMAVSQEFAAARPKKPLLIIVDCDCAACTALGNYRTAKLLRDCRCARFVFVSSAMKPAYRGLAHEMGFTLIERDSLSMNISEVMEYAGRCGISFNAREAYSACRGSFLGCKDIATITGQKPITTKARKSVANFKVREGETVGVKVTLRGDRMWEFLDRLFNVALPRVRDFRGINPNSFDGRGNYAFGLKEQLIFPEIEYDKVDKIRGMDICICTTATTDEEAKELLTMVGAPFYA